MSDQASHDEDVRPTVTLGRSRPFSEQPVFTPGEVVAGRYRILRFLARGGGGEVYEAEDQELRVPVALKTVGRAEAQDDETLQRFRREIQMARRVTHRNVCRIYDVGRYRRGAEAGGEEILFLTMELLAGETLAACLARRGSLPLPEALGIARQTAAGLDAAHRAGVVHRDLKSSNVMLVPDAGEPGEIRAAITDFGLARGGPEEESRFAPTGSVSFIGTPAYMAPEQVEGGAATPRSDVYAFGVVLYEMVTGALPFQGANALETAFQRLKQRAPSPRRVRQDLDERWERVILRCLEGSARARPASAGEAVRALERRRLPRRRRARRPGAGLTLFLLFLLAGGALVAYRAWRETAPAAAARPPVAPGHPRPAVAVLGFQNLTRRAEADWLSTALAEMIATELAAGERLRPVAGETVARMKSELHLAATDSLAADTLARVRAHSGTEFVVLGSYTALGEPSGGRLRLDLRLQETASGRSLGPVSEEGTEATLFEMVHRAGAALRRRLGVEEGAPPAGAPPPSLPADPAAARLYAQGLERLRGFDPRGAKELLQRVTAAEPGFAPAHSALADAWQGLGYRGRAREEAERAYGLCAGLRREERLLIEARLRALAHQWAEAVELLRALGREYPDEVEHGVRLVHALVEAGRAQQALEAAEALQGGAGGAGGGPAVDLAEGEAAGRLSDFARQLEAARRGRRRGEEIGALWLVATAGLQEGAALQKLGRGEEARAALAASRTDFQAVGDRGGAARALRQLSILLRSQGDLDGAERRCAEALAELRQIGDQGQTAGALVTLANVAYDRGRLGEAAGRYEEALAVYREIDDQRGASATLGNLANVLALQGDPDGAVRAHEEALGLKRRLGYRSGEAISLIGLGAALHERGEPAAAAARLEEALSLCRETGERSLAAHALYTLGEVLRARGDLAGSRQRQGEALSERLALGEEASAMDCRLALALLDIEEGRPAEAAAVAGEAAALHAAGGARDSLAQAESVRARALLAGGNGAAALAAAGRAQEAVDGEYRLLGLLTSLVASQARAAAGEPQQARAALREIGREAADRHLHLLATEAGLAEGVIARDAGEPGARQRLARLAGEAEGRELGLLAGKLREAAAAP